ncbi:MAG: hypothetical protein RSD40_04755 [Bacilli bacterium]
MARTEAEMWEILKEYGITNMEEFEKACKENEFNMAPFTQPLKNKEC